MVHQVRLVETIATAAVRSPEDEHRRRTRGLKVERDGASALHAACATRACTGKKTTTWRHVNATWSHVTARWSHVSATWAPGQRHVGARSSPRQHQVGATWLTRQRHVSRRLTWQSSGSLVSRPSGSARPAVQLRSGFGVLLNHSGFE